MAKHLIQTKSELVEAVKELCTHNRLSHDVESKGPTHTPDICGLYPFHGARSFSHIIGTKNDEYYFNFNVGGINPKYKKLLQPIFDDENRIIFYVNALFDAGISHFDGLKFKQRIIDCPSIARIEYNKHGKQKGDESFLSMEYLADYYKVQKKNDLVKQYIVEHDLYAKDQNGDYIKCRLSGKKIPLFDKVPLDLMFNYGCDDARTTYDIGDKILRCINFKDQSYQNDRGDLPTMLSVAQNEVQLTSVLVDMKIEGMRIWPDYIKKAIKHEKAISDKLHKEIDRITGGINLSSGKQVADYLQSKGVKVPRKEPTEKDELMINNWLKKAELFKSQGKEKQYAQAMEKVRGYEQGRPITDKKTLAKLMEQNPELDFLGKITHAKEADKKISTYYSPFLKLADDNDIIHCGLNQETAKTGRFSSSEPNLQNLHKEKWQLGEDEFLIRKSFIAFDGYFLLFADYDQQEMMVMLDQAGEMGVINKLKSGEYADFYLATAAILKEVTGIEISRKEAKAMALGLAYGKGLTLLAKELGYIPINATELEIEEGREKASTFKRQFFDALPKLKRLQKRLERDAKCYGKIHNAFGRVIYLAPDESYKALNAFVQSTSADITKKAMVNLHKDFTENKLTSKLSLVIHDEICCNVKFEEEEKVIAMVKDAMIKAYPYLHIPLSVGFEKSNLNSYGVSAWGEKQEIAA